MWVVHTCANCVSSVSTLTSDLKWIVSEEEMFDGGDDDDGGEEEDAGSPPMTGKVE